MITDRRQQLEGGVWFVVTAAGSHVHHFYERVDTGLPVGWILITHILKWKLDYLSLESTMAFMLSSKVGQ